MVGTSNFYRFLKWPLNILDPTSAISVALHDLGQGTYHLPSLPRRCHKPWTCGSPGTLRDEPFGFGPENVGYIPNDS